MRWSEFYGILKATDQRPNTVICLYKQSFVALQGNTMKFLIFMELLWENKFLKKNTGADMQVERNRPTRRNRKGEWPGCVRPNV